MDYIDDNKVLKCVDDIELDLKDSLDDPLSRVCVAYTLLHNYLVAAVSCSPEDKRSEIVISYLSALSRDILDTLEDTTPL